MQRSHHRLERNQCRVGSSLISAPASGLQISPSGLRSAFTLIELIVVILVIGILAAILLPAINNVRLRAREAQVVVDIKNLEKAIADFKLKYQVEPPSSFRLYENGTWDMTNTLDKNSVAIIRQIWPNYSMSSSGTNMVAATVPGDLNNNGTIDTTPITFNGAECLAFFLGGPGLLNLSGSSSTPVPQTVNANGFSANPSNPFASGGNRVGPFYEIDASRLSDVDSDGVYELLDPLPSQTMPYQYLSSYGGRGYQPRGYDGDTSTTDDEVIVISGSRTMVSPYLKTDTVGPGGGATGYPGGVAWNQKTFQIISPGFDGNYGPGGMFTVAGSNTSANGIAIQNAGTDNYRSRSGQTLNRQDEADNITNFTGGTLTNFYPAW